MCAPWLNRLPRQSFGLPRNDVSLDFSNLPRNDVVWLTDFFAMMFNALIFGHKKNRF